MKQQTNIVVVENWKDPLIRRSQWQYWDRNHMTKRGFESHSIFFQLIYSLSLTCEAIICDVFLGDIICHIYIML